jgi:hypothetical protein
VYRSADAERFRGGDEAADVSRCDCSSHSPALGRDSSQAATLAARVSVAVAAKAAHRRGRRHQRAHPSPTTLNPLTGQCPILLYRMPTKHPRGRESRRGAEIFTRIFRAFGALAISSLVSNLVSRASRCARLSRTKIGLIEDDLSQPVSTPAISGVDKKTVLVHGNLG